MVKINLLPWREELRKRKRIEFFQGVGAGVTFALLLVFLAYIYVEGLKEYQLNRNKLVKSEITILDMKIQEIKDVEEKKNKLLTKIDIIQKLQESRPEIVHLFDELSKITPEGIFLSRFVQNSGVLTFDGKAESNARVSAFMRAIDSSPWLNTSALSVIKGQGHSNGELYDFTLTAKQGKKSADKK